MRFSFIYFLLLLGGLSGCDIINPEEEIPAYIYIDEFTLTTDEQTEGTASSNLTDAWVYVNDDLVGIYELPARFPVLVKGNAEIIVAPGIMDNGIASLRAIYPFFNSYITSIELKELETDTIRPVTTYRDNTKFAFLEDFENGVQFELIEGDAEMVRATEPAKVFEGTASAAVYLNALTDSGIFISSEKHVLNPSTPAYLEMNYKSDDTLLVGLTGYIGSTTVNTFPIGILPSDGLWKKIYINLTPAVDFLKADSYSILIHAVKSPVRPTSTIFIDNVKLIH